MDIDIYSHQLNVKHIHLPYSLLVFEFQEANEGRSEVQFVLVRNHKLDPPFQFFNKIGQRAVEHNGKLVVMGAGVDDHCLADAARQVQLFYSLLFKVVVVDLKNTLEHKHL